MLGYCKPDKEELRLKDVRCYSAYYCTLCQGIKKRYGRLSTIALSNDAVFLLICLDAAEKDKELLKGRCPFAPIWKQTKMYVNPTAVYHAAFINYYLVLQKLYDYQKDSRNAFLRCIYKIIYKMMSGSHKYKADKEKYSDLIDCLDREFGSLYSLEQQNADFDLITNTFGRIVRLFSDSYLENYDPLIKNGIGTIMFNMGKWLYLADALDDYEKDKKNGEFNLIDKLSLPENMNMDSMQNINEQKSRMILALLQAKMFEGYYQVEWNNSKEIIENIIHYGPVSVFKSILHKKNTTLFKEIVHGIKNQFC